MTQLGDLIVDRLPAPNPRSATLPFPSDILPSAIRGYVERSAQSIGVPVDMVAMPLLVLAGATIGNRLYIVLKQGFHQYPTLFAAIIAPPGSAKSPALLAAQMPLNALQAEAHSVYQSQRTEWERDLELWQVTKENRGPKPVPPELEHLFTTDATIEALIGMLARSPGIAMLRDEISGLVTSLDQYRGGKGSDRQHFLQLWAGSAIKADRKGGEPVFVPHPVAGIVGGIQPDLLATLHSRSHARDGFIERFLLVYPRIEPVGWTEEVLDQRLLDPVIHVFTALRRIPSSGAGDGGHAVLLHPDARRLWIDWYNDNTNLQRDTRGLRQGFYAKLPNHVARLALILSALWNHDDPRRMVSADRMADAIELGEYLRAQLDRVLPSLTVDDPQNESGLPGRIVRILRKFLREVNGDPEGWVRRKVILQRLGNVTSEHLTAALEALEAAGTIESRIAPGTTTKPATEWRLVEKRPLGLSTFSNNPQGQGSWSESEPSGGREVSTWSSPSGTALGMPGPEEHAAGLVDLDADMVLSRVGTAADDVADDDPGEMF